jgi:polyisoprenyl-phosphate glycosyltransferase
LTESTDVPVQASTPTRSDIFVSVVVPLGNDGPYISEFLAELVGVLRPRYANYEVILVDDYSLDDTVERVLGLLQTTECLRLIRLSRSFGQDVAIGAGLDAAIGDFIVTMLPSSDPPALVPEAVELAREGGSGVIVGVRRSRAGEPIAVRLGANLFHRIVRPLLRLNVPERATQFRVFSRQALNAVLAIRDRRRQLRVIATHVGYAFRSLTYDPLERGRPRRLGIWDGVDLAIDLMLAGGRNPLRLVSWLGVVASLLNVLYAAYVIAIYLLRAEVAEGWTTLSLQSAIMFFLIFALLTMLAEYVAHILQETQDRPRYNVLDEHNSSVLLADEERRNVVVEFENPA